MSIIVKKCRPLKLDSAKKVLSLILTKQDYDQWRYKYPKLYKFNRRRHKVTPPIKLNDALTDELMKEKSKRRK